jgi:ubiquinone/menaquinone biosynthesis C-methylase UbiE
MKVRDSAMPEQDYWETLFDVNLIIDKMGITQSISQLIEFGCGYGTFTLPSAQRINGQVISFDIEDSMLSVSKKRMVERHISNVIFTKRDFVADGTGLEDNSADYCMLFNILHHTEPLQLLHEAYRILKIGGKAGFIHWNYDAKTPRGPSLDIRPKPEDMKKWAVQAGFHIAGNHIDLPPYHYGYVGHRW